MCIILKEHYIKEFRTLIYLVQSNSYSKQIRELPSPRPLVRHVPRRVSFVPVITPTVTPLPVVVQVEHMC